MNLFKKIFGSADLDQNPFHRMGIDTFLPDDDMIEYMMPTPEEVIPTSQYIRQSLGLFISKKWAKDKVIKVLWADGDADIQAKTMQDWQTGIVQKIRASGNKVFDIVVTTNPAECDMRISFTQNNQAWSYVGTDCGHVAKTGNITMNLGWHIRYRNNEGNERFGTGCHEMLHALGYIHTLQSPACEGKLIWNKEFVYAKYAKIGWSRAQVDSQVFAKYNADQISDNGCDFDSIMCYQVGPGEANIVNKRNNSFTAIDNAKLIADYGSIINPPPPPPPTSNIISIGKQASQSSLWDPMPNSNPGYYSVKKINDGIKSPANFMHTLSEVNPWVQIDLGSSMNVSSIKIYNRMSCPKCVGRLNKFRVYVTETPLAPGYPIGHVYENNAVIPDGGIIHIALNGVKGRYVRLVCNNNPPTYLHLAEIEVFG